MIKIKKIKYFNGKKSKSISELTKEIESIYDKDPTLKELKRLEEDRKTLSSINIGVVT